MAWVRRDANGAPVTNAAAGIPVWENGASVVSVPTQLDFRHGLDVTGAAGGAQVAVDESELSVPQANVANLVSDLAGKQPLDSDLTAIAALATTSFGRSLLAEANAASLLADLGAESIATAAGRYRLLIRVPGYSRGATVITAAGDYQMQNTGSLNTQSVASAQPGPFYLDPADHAVAGLTAKLRVVSGILVNDTAPGITLVVGLYAVGTPSGGVSVLNPNLTVVSGSTVTFTTPFANVHAAPDSSGDFTFPAAGWYQFGVHADGAQAGNSVVSLPTRLEVRNV